MDLGKLVDSLFAQASEMLKEIKIDQSDAVFTSRMAASITIQAIGRAVLEAMKEDEA